MMSWGCHQCGRSTRRPFLWWAKRASMRHERRTHGHSVYDRKDSVR